MPSTPSSNFDNRAELFKALAHPIRLLIINLIKIKPRHGEELALILRLNPATVSHHLNLLTDAGLLQSQKDQYYQTYSLIAQPFTKTLTELIFMPQTEMPGNIEEDAYRKKVLNTFLRHGRLIKIPAQLKKRQVIFEKIAEEFEPGKQYPEREVNIILLDYNDDVAALRRGLVEAELLVRKNNVYQRNIS